MKAVLFDYDDTLVQTRQCKYLALQALARRDYGFELSAAELDEHWGIPYLELFRRLFGAVESDIERAAKRYEELDAEFPMRPYPDTLRVLATLSERCLVGIVTAAGRSIVERQLRELGIGAGALVLLQTAEDTPHHKPDPRVFEPALAMLAQRGALPESVTYVGDSLKDYFAARDAGLQFFGVLHGTTTQQAFLEAGASTVGSLDELLVRV